MFSVVRSTSTFSRNASYKGVVLGVCILVAEVHEKTGAN